MFYAGSKPVRRDQAIVLSAFFPGPQMISRQWTTRCEPSCRSDDSAATLAPYCVPRQITAKRSDDGEVTAAPFCVPEQLTALSQ